jgi:hypothetical protein
MGITLEQKMDEDQPGLRIQVGKQFVMLIYYHDNYDEVIGHILLELWPAFKVEYGLSKQI